MIGDRIAKVRKQKGLTQQKLAEQMSVSPRVICSWELNETTPTFDLVKALAEYFNVSLDYFAERGIYADSTISDEELSSADDLELIQQYHDLSKKNQQIVKDLVTSLSYSVDSPARTIKYECNISFQPNEYFLKRSDPDYKKMRIYCQDLKSLKERSDYENIDIARFMWQIGATDFSLNDFSMICNQVKVPSKKLANALTEFLDGEVHISIDD